MLTTENAWVCFGVRELSTTPDKLGVRINYGVRRGLAYQEPERKSACLSGDALKQLRISHAFSHDDQHAGW